MIFTKYKGGANVCYLTQLSLAIMENFEKL